MLYIYLYLSILCLKIFDGGVAVLFNGFQGSIANLHLPFHGTKSEKNIKENKQVSTFILLLPSSKS